jgi:Tfp pilus assembly protein PilN
MAVINLLPTEHKREIRAARTNVLLVRYIAILTTAFVVLGGLLAGAYVVLNVERDAAIATVKENEQRVASYQPVRLQAESYRTDLTIAKSILDQKASYTALIYKIANIIPSNVVLDDLVIDPRTFGSTVTLNASSKSYDDATRLKDALKKNKEIFTNVQVISLRATETSEGAEQIEYPVKATLSVVFNREALK